MPFYPPSSPPLPSASADCCSPARRALLPSFEPTPSKSSSSPSSSRVRTPSRKRARDDEDDAAPGKQLEPPAYPTPAPTSSAALTVSSPTSSVSRALLALGGADINKSTTTAPSKPAPLSASAAVPVLSSTSSSTTTPSLRAPLSTVALARLPRSGTEVSLGRSSASSTVVLSRTNKLISRVHIVARYLESHDSIEISCHGWNGARVGTPALEHALAKGERVEIGADTPIIIDVCGERARVEVIDDREAETDALEDDEETDDEIFVNHPAAKLGSPTPMVAPTNSTSTISTKSGPISNAPKRARGPENVGFKVWEDKEEDSGVTKKENVRINDASPLPSTSSENAPGSVASSKTVSIPQEQSTDQENSKQPLQPQQQEQQEPQELQQQSREPSPEDEQDKLRIHIIAHLAYSRLASTPLSVLRASLPIIEFVPDDKLRSTIKDIACVGVIQRKGKDASGKRLEEQYYYIPEQDDDIHRRAAVEELRGGAGIRSCRKVHKQYFWRKPAVK
ncbi:hypothetical protein BZA70DRAFT_283100 [Myxozyma melibiosi]|uniref:FHA domain-containing protein n=1 Tax=Myxozyma melibiosi TaxID=54550 RepID=A0ABR1F1E2_9ASCO